MLSLQHQNGSKDSVVNLGGGNDNGELDLACDF